MSDEFRGRPAQKKHRENLGVAIRENQAERSTSPYAARPLNPCSRWAPNACLQAFRSRLLERDCTPAGRQGLPGIQHWFKAAIAARRASQANSALHSSKSRTPVSDLRFALVLSPSMRGPTVVAFSAPQFFVMRQPGAFTSPICSKRHK